MTRYYRMKGMNIDCSVPFAGTAFVPLVNSTPVLGTNIDSAQMNKQFCVDVSLLKAQDRGWNCVAADWMQWISIITDWEGTWRLSLSRNVGKVLWFIGMQVVARAEVEHSPVGTRLSAAFFQNHGWKPDWDEIERYVCLLVWLCGEVAPADTGSC